ncbi:hypothetical protein RCJ22_33230, partial [Vibrio sp. FNV 38]|nr:hypothetical protein [Vibrio sp. FNV 38]
TADAQDTSQIVLDGEITVDILDGGDGFENRFEVPSVIIEGTTDNIPDGATILLTITDVDGKQVSTSAVANDGVYRVEGVDIASLAEGDLTVRAEVGGAFTTIEAFDDTIKDTLAEVTGELDGLGDSTINFVEQDNATVSGDVEYVEDGQTVQVVITDEAGESVSVATTVSAQSWSIDDVDLTSLQDGVLTVTSTTIDIAGNP